MFCAIKTRLQASFDKVLLHFLLLTANITETQLLALLLQRVQLSQLLCLITLHQVLLLITIAATSYKLVQI